MAQLARETFHRGQTVAKADATKNIVEKPIERCAEMPLRWQWPRWPSVFMWLMMASMAERRRSATEWAQFRARSCAAQEGDGAAGDRRSAQCLSRGRHEAGELPLSQRRSGGGEVISRSISLHRRPSESTVWAPTRAHRWPWKCPDDVVGGSCRSLC